MQEYIPMTSVIVQAFEKWKLFVPFIFQHTLVFTKSNIDWKVIKKNNI